MTKKRFARFLAVLLAIVMLVQSVPAQVFAALNTPWRMVRIDR